MGLLERAISAIGKRNRIEVNTQTETPKTVLEFATLLKKELAGVVCVYPWKSLRSSENGERTFEYGLDYFSISTSGKSLFFQERFGRFDPNHDYDFRNKVTAISRIKLIKELTGGINNYGTDGYMVMKRYYLAEPIDPKIYPSMLLDAKQRGIEPFPLPVPGIFEKTMDETTQT